MAGSFGEATMGAVSDPFLNFLKLSYFQLERGGGRGETEIGP